MFKINLNVSIPYVKFIHAINFEHLFNNSMPVSGTLSLLFIWRENNASLAGLSLSIFFQKNLSFLHKYAIWVVDFERLDITV